MRHRLFALLLVLLASPSVSRTGLAADAVPADAAPATETLVLGGGCFWCLEAVYDLLAGVVEAESGYAGGHVEHPDYAAVTRGDTGHAEVVRIVFDPKRITRDDLLRVYFTIHDPTTVNRQGADVGPQYRSIAFYGDEAQKTAIARAIAEAAASGEYRGAIVTEVKPLTVFYPAEDYHQQYFELNGSEPYCSMVIAPKVAKFRKRFAALLK